MSRAKATKGSSHYFAGLRNASVHDLAAFASAAAGLVHFFPRTPEKNKGYFTKARNSDGNVWIGFSRCFGSSALSTGSVLA
jgi:hypothetical protein